MSAATVTISITRQESDSPRYRVEHIELHGQVHQNKGKGDKWMIGWFSTPKQHEDTAIAIDHLIAEITKAVEGDAQNGGES